MGFHEDSRHTDRNGGAGQGRHEFALTARRGALPARLLHRVGGVKHHRSTETGHDRQRAHVGDQRVVAEADTAFAGHDIGIAGVSDLAEHILHVPGREELALLHIDRLAGLGGCDQKIGLAAQEGRDLDHVHRLGGQRGLLGGVDIGQHRQAGGVADLLEDRQRGFQTHPARALVRGAVRLVVGGLVDQSDIEPVGDLAQLLGDFQPVFPAFQLAGTRDQGEPAVIADLDRVAAGPRNGNDGIDLAHAESPCDPGFRGSPVH